MYQTLFSAIRMYRPEFPNVNDVVVVTVCEVGDMGAYVKLKEYGGREGMILYSELSRRRIRSIQKLIRVNRDEVAVVLRVDKEKGYIDLSKRRVSPEEKKLCEEKFKRSNTVQGIMIHVAEKCNIPLLELHEKVTWPLYDKYGHALDAFKTAIESPDDVFDSIDISPNVRKELLANIAHRLTPAPIKIRADLEITCYAYEGVNAIRRALKAGSSFSNKNVTLSLRLVSPPQYVASAVSFDEALGFSALKDSITAIEASITAEGGRLLIKQPARVVSAFDDRKLNETMERAEKENDEVSGDDDSDQEDDFSDVE